jgi:hypothetical protein
LIQTPLLQLLSLEHKKDYRIAIEHREDKPSMGYTKYTKDFVKLVEGLTGGKIEHTEDNAA